MARFLIIEPHADIRRLYAAVVRGSGHEADFFGEDAIAEPQVILVEPADPVSFEAAKRLRHMYPNVAIVCASIYESTLTDVEVLQASAYLLKPFTLVELTDALLGPLDTQAAKQKLFSDRLTTPLARGRTRERTAGLGTDRNGRHRRDVRR